MKQVFVDTSGIIAFAVASDESHAVAAAIFDRLAAQDAGLVTTSYVLCETYALLQRRVGQGAVGRMRATMAPLLEVVWVNADLHNAGLDRLTDDGRRSFSLVDAVSFEVMRRQGIDRAFAFDPHFTEAGFSLLG